MARNPNDITAYRRKSRFKNNITRIVAISLVVFAIFFIWTNGEAIFAPLRGIASQTGTEGFPITLSGGAGYSVSRFGSNFLLLSDTYLYAYTAGGGQIFAHRHNYARPVARATDRRILLYNLNSHEFSLFNRNNRLFEVKVDDRIVLAALGENDMTAIVTTSTAFSNIIEVYDGGGTWLYRRRFTDEEVNAVAFTRSGELIVATSTEEYGEIVSKIYKLRTYSEDDIIWEQTLPPGAWALSVRETGSNIIVLADNMILTLNSSGGEVIGSCEFSSGVLVKPVFNESFNLVVLDDIVTGRTLYMTVDEASGLISEEIMPFGVRQVEIYSERVYTLSESFVYIHDKFLAEPVVIELENEYEDFIIIGNYALLLGYNTIEQIGFN